MVLNLKNLMQSNQDIRLKEFQLIEKRLNEYQIFKSSMNIEQIILNKEISIDILYVFDNQFNQQKELLKQLKSNVGRYAFCSINSPLHLTNFLNYEDALLAIENLPPKSKSTNLSIILGTLTKTVEWKSPQRRIIITLTNETKENFYNGFCSYFTKYLEMNNVEVFFHLTQPSLYSTVIHYHSLLPSTKLLNQINVLPRRKKQDMKKYLKKGFLISIPLTYWENSTFTSYESVSHYNVQPVNILYNQYCNRYSENSRYAEYDCSYNGIEGKLLQETNDSYNELVVKFEEIEMRSWCCYMANTFNSQFQNKKKIHITPRYIFVEDESQLFRNEEWSYSKDTILQRIQNKQVYLVQKKSNGVKIINEQMSHTSSTLDCFMHWSFFKSNLNGLVVVEKGKLNRTKHRYEIDSCYVAHSSYSKFFFTRAPKEDGIVQFFNGHSCNFYCHNASLPRHKDQKGLDDDDDMTVSTCIITH